MKDIVLKAEKRELATKGTLNTLRREGRIPAVTYGDNEAPLALTLDEKSLQQAIHSERGRNALISLEVGSDKHAVLVKDIQRDPISRAIIHVDLYRISLKKKIETRVPVHVIGEAPGVKLGGGILEHITREVRVKCLPGDIPSVINVDVSQLQVNQGIKLREIQAPNGVEWLNEPDTVLVNIVVPTELEEVAAPGTEAAAGTTAGEPEVIKKGKVEEGAEGAAAGAKAPAAGAKPAAAAAKPEGKK